MDKAEDFIKYQSCNQAQNKTFMGFLIYTLNIFKTVLLLFKALETALIVEYVDYELLVN